MLALTPTLRAAQQSSSAQPRLHARLFDRDHGVVRLRWSRWYSGVEVDGPAATAVADDDALVRARIDPGTGTLHVQRVPTPGAASDYTAWTALGAAGVAAGVGCSAAGQRVLLATASAAGTTVEVRESVDGGASYGAPAAIATAASAITAVACVLRADGGAAVFFAAAGVVSSVTRTGLGAWGAPTPWSRSLATVDGLANLDELDYAVLVSGTDPAGRAGVWSTLFGSGLGLPAGLWSALVPLAEASVGTGVSYRAAGFAIAGGVPRASIVERGALDRAHVASTTDGTQLLSGAWRDPRPFEQLTAFGLALAARGQHAYLATPAGVWHAPLDAPIEELTDDLVSLELETVGAFGVARGRVTLTDEAARYAPGAAPAAFAPGGELLLEAGYVTAAGEETVELGTLAITAVRRGLRRGQVRITLELEGLGGAIDRWRAASQLTFAAGTTSLLDLATEVARRAGVRLLVDGPSAELTTLTPPFTVRAGQHGGAALRSLLERVPDFVRARDGALVLTEPTEADPTDYAYGAGHPIEALDLVDDAPSVGRVRVFGAVDIGEAVDPLALERGAASTVVVDDALDSPARVDARAATVLRRATAEATAATLTARANVAQEVGDVVAVTDAALGLDAARFRVSTVRFRFSREGHPAAEMRLTLTQV